MSDLGDVIIALPLEDRGFDDDYLAMMPQSCREPLQDTRIQARLMRVANLAGFAGNAQCNTDNPRNREFLRIVTKDLALEVRELMREVETMNYLKGA